MINLTNPKNVDSTLGATNGQIAYNRIVLSPIAIDPIAQTIQASIQLVSSTTPEAPPIIGVVTISIPQAKARVEVGDTVRKSVSLTSPQNTAALKVITDAQDALEKGIVNLGLVLGVQAPGV